MNEEAIRLIEESLEKVRIVDKKDLWKWNTKELRNMLSEIHRLYGNKGVKYALYRILIEVAVDRVKCSRHVCFKNEWIDLARKELEEAINIVSTLIPEYLPEYKSMWKSLKREISKEFDEIVTYIAETAMKKRDRDPITLYRSYCNNYGEEPRRLSEEELKDLLPWRIVHIEHNGPLKILAFSDYRVHDIEALLKYVKDLKEKPDIIIYAGDDIIRFAPLPFPPRVFIEGEKIRVGESVYMFSKLAPKRDEYFEELHQIKVHEWGPGKVMSYSLNEYILVLPRGYNIEPLSRILSVLKTIEQIEDMMEGLKISGKDSDDVVANKIISIIKSTYPRLNILTKDDMFRRRKILMIIDPDTNTKLLDIEIHGGRPILEGTYIWLYRRILDPQELSCVKIYEDKHFNYYYISPHRRGDRNLFEELARESRYGLAAVIGNSDMNIDRLRISGDKVYELHSTLLKIGSFLIAGLEGTIGEGIVGGFGRYGECDYRFRLEYIRSLAGQGDKLVLVTHTPPRGILDRAMRYGERSVGSVALREFIEEYEVPLAICGHVHRLGGVSEWLGRTRVVNVSSHDFIAEKANIALITLYEDGRSEVEFHKLPSPVELAPPERRLDMLRRVLGLSENELYWFRKAYEKHGDRLFKDLDRLAIMKYKYSLTWGATLEMYDMGIRDASQLDNATIEAVRKRLKWVHLISFERALPKILRERTGEICLLNPPPFDPNDRIIIVDTEYYVEPGAGVKPVLVGFIDTSAGEIQQFWFDEIDRLLEFLDRRKDHLFVHYGGADKKVLRSLIEDKISIRIKDMLYYIQTSLVAPVSSASLKEVFDALAGHRDDEWWADNFYNADGFTKLWLCGKILKEPEDEEAKKKLLEINKADLLAFKAIIEKLAAIKRCIKYLPIS